MSLSLKVIDTLQDAKAKALATDGPHGINVIPVSAIKINQDSIWLFDFFMNKTTSNLQSNQQIALTAWTDLVGVQVKGDAQYVTEGEELDKAVTWIKENHPNRTTKALIIFTPSTVFDISPGGAFSADELVI